MKIKSLLIAVVLLAVAAAVVFFLKTPSAKTAVDPRVGRTIAEGIPLDKAQLIRVRNKDNTITLARQPDKSWVVQEYHALPADFGKISSLVSALTDAKITRFVTANPARLKRMEFTDHLEFLAAPNQPLLTLVFGKNDDNGGRFLRFGDEPRAYLTEHDVYFDINAKVWTDSRLLSFTSDDIAKVEIAFDHGTKLTARRAKKEDAFTAENPPAGKQLLHEQILMLLGQFTKLRFSDTREPADPEVVAAKKNTRTLVFEQFNGTRTTVVLGRRPATPLAPPGPVIAFITSSKADAPINALMRRRAFEISSYVFMTMLEKPDRYFTDAGPAGPPAPPPVGPKE